MPLRSPPNSAAVRQIRGRAFWPALVIDLVGSVIVPFALGLFFSLYYRGQMSHEAIYRAVAATEFRVAIFMGPLLFAACGGWVAGKSAPQAPVWNGVLPAVVVVLLYFVRAPHFWSSEALARLLMIPAGLFGAWLARRGIRLRAAATPPAEAKSDRQH